MRTRPLALIASALLLMPLAAGATAFAQLRYSGWGAENGSASDGPRNAVASVGRSRAGTFFDGEAYEFTISTTANEAGGSLRSLMLGDSASEVAFGDLSGSASFNGTARISRSATVRLRLDLRGSFETLSGFAGMDTSGYLSLGNTESFANLHYLAPGHDIAVTNTGGSFVVMSLDPLHTHLRLEVSRALIGGETFSIHAAMSSSLTTRGVDIAQNDFSHTAQISVLVPEGVEFLTEGDFLSQLPAVPEPPTAGLAAAGLALLWCGRRRLRRCAEVL